MHTYTKIYRDLPAAHRRPNHDGHCRLIHGHNWTFEITFAAETRDANGFVIDAGKLGPVKEWIEHTFDHTLLLDIDDPIWQGLKDPLEDFPAKVVVVPSCGMEGLAEYVYDHVSEIVQDMALHLGRKIEVVRVVCREDSRNSATFEP